MFSPFLSLMVSLVVQNTSKMEKRASQKYKFKKYLKCAKRMYKMVYYQLKEHLVISPATLLFFSFFWKWADGVPGLPSNLKPMFVQGVFVPFMGNQCFSKGVFCAFYGHIFSSINYNQST